MAETRQIASGLGDSIAASVEVGEQVSLEVMTLSLQTQALS
jgi:hypothetical protein